MRILLIYPPPWKIPYPGEAPDQSGEGPYKGWSPDIPFSLDEIQIPYGLLTLAAQAKRAGHDVSVLNFYTFSWKDIEKILQKIHADLYGLSCFTSNRRGTLSLARLIKQIHTKSYVAVGGPHATPLAQEILQWCHAIDGVFIGEGEETLMELIKCLEAGEATDQIAGMAHRTEHGIHITPRRERIKDLDSLAKPSDYFELRIILTARGCPSNCTFCGSPAIWGKKVRFHSAGYVLNILEKLVNVYKIRSLAIKDDTFTASRKRVLEICKGIEERKLNFIWSCDSRVDSVDEEVLYAMRKAGCQRIGFGIESGSQKILNSINKKTTPEEMLNATRMAQKFGFMIRYYMIVANRGESAETIQESIDFIQKAMPNHLSFGYLSIAPGTMEFQIAEQNGMMTREMFFSKDYPCFFYPIDLENDSKLKDKMDWVNRHIYMEDFSEYNIEQYETILKIFPDNAPAHLDLGKAYFKADIFDKAYEHIINAINLGHPFPGFAYNYLAIIAFKCNDYEICTSLLRESQKHGNHDIVNENLKVVEDWLSSNRTTSKKPTLIARHDFQVPQKFEQPIFPGQISIK